MDGPRGGDPAACVVCPWLRGEAQIESSGLLGKARTLRRGAVPRRVAQERVRQTVVSRHAVCEATLRPDGGPGRWIGVVGRSKGRKDGWWMLRSLEVMDVTKSEPPSTDRPGAALQGLLDLRPAPSAERMAPTAEEDAVAQGLAVAKVYAFVSIDYPGACGSFVFDGDGNDAAGTFTFDNEAFTAFTFTAGVYQILAVPNSIFSMATGFNGFGLIVGLYLDPTGALRGFTDSGGSFSDVQFPGASGTEAIGANDAGQIVGDYIDPANVQHGFVSSGGVFTAIDFPGATGTAAAGINATGDIVGSWSNGSGSHGFLLQSGAFTPIDFPLATSTRAWGINDTGEIAGYYHDAGGITHGFIYSAGAFSTVDVAGARDTFLTGIQNVGLITGACYDTLSEVHGLVGQ